jgi:hypothetical protein
MVHAQAFAWIQADFDAPGVAAELVKVPAHEGGAQKVGAIEEG